MYNNYGRHGTKKSVVQKHKKNYFCGGKYFVDVSND